MREEGRKEGRARGRGEREGIRGEEGENVCDCISTKITPPSPEVMGSCDW